MRDLRLPWVIIISFLLLPGSPLISPSFDHTLISDRVSPQEFVPVMEKGIGVTQDFDLGIYFVPDENYHSAWTTVNELEASSYKIIRSSATFQSDAQIFPSTNLQLDFSMQLPDFTIIEPENFVDTIDLQPLWDQGFNGSGITIAIIDTGVNAEHPALIGKLIDEESFHKQIYGFDADLSAEDVHGHGTAVSSAALGYDPENNFKSPGFSSNLVSARIGLDGGYSTTASVVAALDWAAVHSDVDIISMSLSEPEEGFDLDPLEEVVNYAVSQGKIFLSSAGNSGLPGDDQYQIGSPSSAPEAISVAASDGSGHPIHFSSEGPSYGNQAKPDVIVTGNNVPVAKFRGGYNTADGTSFSTPLVSGTVATLLHASKEMGLNLTPGQMKAILLNSTTDLGADHFSQGFGRINATSALSIIQNIEDYRPVIGPSQHHEQQITHQVPLKTPVYIPISLIGFPSTEFEIISDQANLDLGAQPIYLGNTSILLVNITLNANLSESKLVIGIKYQAEASEVVQWYTFFVEVLAEPDFNMLIDLKHTILDTFFTSPQKIRLERLGGPDFQHIWDVVRSQNGWMTELLYQEYSSQTLQAYDLLWMPSAFYEASTILYDHRVTPSLISSDEIFILRDYLQSGGTLLVDIDGRTSYSNYAFETHLPSLEALSYLLGINLENQGGDLGSDTAQDSVLFPFKGISSAGEFTFEHGFTVVGSNGNSSGLFVSTNEKTAYLHNSRNWRVSGGNVDTNQSFTNIIISSLLNNSIPRYSLHPGEVVLQGQEMLSLLTSFQNDLNIELSINGIASQLIGFDFSTVAKFFINSKEGDEILLSVGNSTNLFFELSAQVPETPGKLIEVVVTEFENELELELEFSRMDFITTTSRLMSDFPLPEYSMSIQANTLRVQINSSLVDINIGGLELETINKDGITQLHTLDEISIISSSSSQFSEPTTASSDQNESQVTWILIPLILVPLFMIFLRRKLNRD